MSMDSEQFLSLLAKYESQILGFLWSVSPRADISEDLFQQTVLTMWQKLDQFEPGTNFLAWACSIAKFKALEYSRARKRLLFDSDIVAQLADKHGSEDDELRLLRRRALVGCMDKLRSDDRQLVDSCYCGERQIMDIAKELGRTARAVYKSLARIRKTLYVCVEAKLAQGEHPA